MSVAVFAVALVAAAVVFGVWATITANSAVFGRLTGLAGVFSLVLAVAVAAAGMIAWARRSPADNRLPAPEAVVAAGLPSDGVGIGDESGSDTSSDTSAIGKDSLLYYCYISEGKVDQILSQSSPPPPSRRSTEKRHEAAQATEESLQQVISDYFGNRPEYGRPDSLRFDGVHQKALVTKLHEALQVIQNELGEVPWLQQEISIGHPVQRGAYLYEGEFVVTNYDHRLAYLSSPLSREMTLRLSCSLRYFSDMWREDEFIPHSGNAMFFSGEVHPFFQTLLYVLQVRDKAVLGTPLYLGQELASELQL